MRINLKRGSWHFGGNVPKKFDSHINLSVPGYADGHKIIKKFSDYFLNNNSTCYDLVCSTGTLLIELSKYSNKKNVKFIGLDCAVFCV